MGNLNDTVKWKKYKDGDKLCLALVLKDYGGGWGGVYLTSDINPGDYYLPVKLLENALEYEE